MTFPVPVYKIYQSKEGIKVNRTQIQRKVNVKNYEHLIIIKPQAQIINELHILENVSSDFKRDHFVVVNAAKINRWEGYFEIPHFAEAILFLKKFNTMLVIPYRDKTPVFMFVTCIGLICIYFYLLMEIVYGDY